MLTDALDAFVERLKHVPGIVAIVVGGSRARGTPTHPRTLILVYTMIGKVRSIPQPLMQLLLRATTASAPD